MSYCMYLRKSRADGPDVFAHHEYILSQLAQKMAVSVEKIYREVVSGDTIGARPQMQALLKDVRERRWEGVLVMEIERLARGDTIDQGTVAQAFRLSGTKIVTPIKVFDPADEFDEEYFEFGLFMSRREYKVINRRMQRGREAAVAAGKWVASTAPYGYRRVRCQNGKGFSLAPVEEQAETVKLIFSLRTQNDSAAAGFPAIARTLNALQIAPPRGSAWSAEAVRAILQNPVYTGVVRWGYRPQTKRIEGAKIATGRPLAPSCTVVPGLHPPIVTKEQFALAQSLRRPPVRRSPAQYALKGLVVCAFCGRRMLRKPQKGGRDILFCPTRGCMNVSAALSSVEAHVLRALTERLRDFPFSLPARKESQLISGGIRAKREALTQQLQKAHDLLERGVYDEATFLARRARLQESLRALQAVLPPSAAPKLFGSFPEVYGQLRTVHAKNTFLRGIIREIVYTKTVNGRWHYAPDAYTLEVRL